MMNQTDQVTTWDTSSEPSTFDPQDWFQYVQRVRGRAVPPVSDLVVLSVINPPLSDVHAELVEQRYGRRVEDFALSGHPFVVIEHEGHQVTVCTSSKGSYSAGAVDALIALGAKKIVLLNVGAALSEEPEVGHYVSATSALRDDGVSNNYLPPSRFIEGSPSLCASLTQMGDGKVHSGAVWVGVELHATMEKMSGQINLRMLFMLRSTPKTVKDVSRAVIATWRKRG